MLQHGTGTGTVRLLFMLPLYLWIREPMSTQDATTALLNVNYVLQGSVCTQIADQWSYIDYDAIYEIRCFSYPFPYIYKKNCQV